MADAISNTSPLLYLYPIGALAWLERIFGAVWIPNAVALEAVALELEHGRQAGFDVPVPDSYSWLHRVEPVAVPSEWAALDLGPGELVAMALALENPAHVVLLDDGRARRIAQTAGRSSASSVQSVPIIR